MMKESHILKSCRQSTVTVLNGCCLRRWAIKKNLIQFQIPPAPPRPDFDASREKLQKLGEGEGSMTKEEFTKMKQELEAYVDLITIFFYIPQLLMLFAVPCFWFSCNGSLWDIGLRIQLLHNQGYLSDHDQSH